MQKPTNGIKKWGGIIGLVLALNAVFQIAESQIDDSVQVHDSCITSHPDIRDTVDQNAGDIKEIKKDIGDIKTNQALQTQQTQQIIELLKEQKEELKNIRNEIRANGG